MPEVMPSQVVLITEQFFARVTKSIPGEGLIHSGQLDGLQGIVNLIREIPSQLINVPTDQYADMVLAITIIEEQGKFRIGRGTSFPIPTIKNVDVATTLYRVLSQCPDEFPPTHIIELIFATDADLRYSI